MFVDWKCEVKHNKFVALRETLTLNAGSLSPFLSPSPNQSLFLTANVIGRNPKPGEWLRAYRGLKMTVRWTAI